MSNLLSQASLVMIPSGYKEDTVYSVVPSDGSGDLSFTRASNGTRINSAGLVEVCPWNLNTNSQIFASGWGTDGTSTATDNNTTAPNGTTTAAKVVANTSNGYAYKSLPVAPGTYTLSYYVKASASATITIALNDIGGSGYQQSSAFSIGTEWQRIEFSATISSGSNLYIDYGNMQTGKDYFIWGAQLNIGSTAKPYFPTTDRLNVPRLTYQNGGGGCPSLLLEKQSTNLFSYSEQLDNGFWTPLQITITANNTTSPDGTQNADKIAEDAVNGVHLFYNTSAVTGSATSTASIFYKKGTRRYFSVKLQIGSNSYTQVFDADGITTGSNSSNGLTSVSTSIVSMGNGWVRASVTGTDPSASTACYMICSLSNSATPTFDAGNFNPTYSGSSSEYGYFWGAQLEASSYPTSYIPTTSSSATRVADECYKTGISSLIGQTEGVFFAEINVINPNTNFGMSLQQTINNSTNTIYFLNIGTVGIFVCDVLLGGATQMGYNKGSALSAGINKIAIAYKQNDFAVALNGSIVHTDNSGNVPTCTSLTFVDAGMGTIYQYMVNQTILFKTRLTNAELASLTTI